MLRYLRLLIAAIALLAIIVFAVGNRQIVSITFFPLPVSAVELPLSLVFLIGVLIGAIIGGIALWLSTGNMRAEYHKLKRRDRALRHQRRVQEQQEVEQAAAKSTQRENMVALPSPSR